MKLKLKIKIKSKHFFYQTNMVSDVREVLKTNESSKIRIKLCSGLVPEFSY